MRVFLTDDPASVLARRPDLAPYAPAVTVTRGFQMPVKIPSWSALDPADRATLFARAKKLYALYHGAGCTNPFAFGMLGVAEGENEDLDPNGVGDFLDAAGKRLPWSEHPTGTPSSFGLHQRKEDRTIAIRDGRKDSTGRVVFEGLGFDIKALALAGTNTLENEVRATLWELKAFPLGYGAAAIFAAQMAYGAAYNATVTFERAGTVANGEATRRAIMAETWLEVSRGTWPLSRGPAPEGWEALASGW